MLFVRSFLRSFVSRQCWPRSGHDRTTAHDHARPTAHDHEWPTTHARPRTTTHDWPRMTHHARTTTHDHALPRTTTHDRPRTHDRGRPTTHDRARPTTAAIFVWGSGTHPTPGGFRGLNCLARLALARERMPSKIKRIYCIIKKIVFSFYDDQF